LDIEGILKFPWDNGRDFHKIMFNHANSLGIDIPMGTLVETYNQVEPSVTLQNTDEVEADIIIGADGK